MALKMFFCLHRHFVLLQSGNPLSYMWRNFIDDLPKAKYDLSGPVLLLLQKTHLGYVPGLQIFLGTIP